MNKRLLTTAFLGLLSLTSVAQAVSTVYSVKGKQRIYHTEAEGNYFESYATDKPNVFLTLKCPRPDVGLLVYFYKTQKSESGKNMLVDQSSYNIFPKSGNENCTGIEALLMQASEKSPIRIRLSGTSYQVLGEQK